MINTIFSWLFCKAYDRINRSLMLLNLQRLGIKCLLYRNIKMIYQVMVEGGSLPPITNQFRLKQGSVLSPLLQLIY